MSEKALETGNDADNNDKRLSEWKIASKKYGDLLNEMVTELQQNRETVPAEEVLREIDKKIEPIHHVGVVFRDDIKRAISSTPPPPKKSLFDY